MKQGHFAVIFGMALVVASAQVALATSGVTALNEYFALQDPSNAGQGKQDFQNVLNLTDDQKAKLKGIRQSEHDQVQAVRNDASLSQEEKEAKLRAIRESMHQEVFGVLTPDQQQALKQKRAEWHKHDRSGGDLGGLGLTDNQKAQLKSIHQSARDQITALKSDQSLSDERKAQRIGEIRRSTHQQALGVLNLEQQNTLRQRRENHRGRFRCREKP
jgi:periplasmic protein CpxP/Spy